MSSLGDGGGRGALEKGRIEVDRRNVHPCQEKRREMNSSEDGETTQSSGHVHPYAFSNCVLGMPHVLD